MGLVSSDGLNLRLRPLCIPVRLAIGAYWFIMGLVALDGPCLRFLELTFMLLARLIIEWVVSLAPQGLYFRIGVQTAADL